MVAGIDFNECFFSEIYLFSASRVFLVFFLTGILFEKRSIVNVLGDKSACGSEISTMRLLDTISVNQKPF